MYLGFLSSYRQRKSCLVPVPEDVVINDTETTQEMTMHRALNGDDGKDIALLGVPGTGKTECINKLLSHYPQHIVHHTEDGTFHQILWIKIEPSSNNDLATLYDNFGIALDNALGNKNVYASLIRKKRKLGEKANYISSLINTFSIGMLIIDEIQRLELNKNRAESFESIMTIMNNTKVLFLVAGTEEAYSIIFNKYYTWRRIGCQISTTMYCRDREYFNVSMPLIMGINWFKTKQEYNRPDILDTMYNITSGKIDLMIKLWKNVQTDYVHLLDEEKKSFVLTPEFIITSSRRHDIFMPEMTRDAISNDLMMRANLKLDEESKKAASKSTKAAGDNDDVVLMKEKLKIMNRFSSLERKDDAYHIYERAKLNLSESGDEYSDETILSVIEKTLSTKNNKNKELKELLSLILRKIRNKPQEKKPKEKASASTDIDLTTFKPEQLDA